MWERWETAGGELNYRGTQSDTCEKGCISTMCTERPEVQKTLGYLQMHLLRHKRGRAVPALRHTGRTHIVTCYDASSWDPVPHAGAFPFGLKVFPEEADTSDLALPGDFFDHFMRRLSGPVGSTGRQGKTNGLLQFWVSTGDISKTTLPYE